MNKTPFQKALGRTDQGDGFDFWETPEIATLALLENIEFTGDILEPAVGKGAISKVLHNSSHISVEYIIGIDIVDRGTFYQHYVEDFLSVDWLNTVKFNNIITNPPYGQVAEKFVEKALTVTKKKVAMLLKLEFLQAVGRYPLLTTTPLKYVLVFPYRVPFQLPGYDKPSTMHRHAWYIWEHGYVGNPMILWVDPANPKRK